MPLESRQGCPTSEQNLGIPRYKFSGGFSGNSFFDSTGLALTTALQQILFLGEFE